MIVSEHQLSIALSRTQFFTKLHSK